MVSAEDGWFVWPLISGWFQTCLSQTESVHSYTMNPRLHFVPLILICLTASGCFGVHHRSHAHSRGASVSEVSVSAANASDRVVDRPSVSVGGGSRVSHHHGHHSSASLGVGVGVAVVAASSSGIAAHYDDSGSYGYLSSDYSDLALTWGYIHQAYGGDNVMEAEHRFELIGYQFREGRIGMRFGFGFSDVELDESDPLVAGIEDVWGLWLDGTLRIHFIEDRHGQPFNPYWEFAMRGKSWTWDYRTSVVDNGDVITGDEISAFDLGVGFGTTISLDHFIIDVGVEAGGTAFESLTAEGYTNDVFDDAWYWATGVRLGYRF